MKRIFRHTVRQRTGKPKWQGGGTKGGKYKLLLFLCVCLSLSCLGSVKETGAAAAAEKPAAENDAVSDEKKETEETPGSLGDLIDRESGYRLYCNYENENWYSFRIYDKEGKILEEQAQLSRCPHLCMPSGELVHAALSAGTSLCYNWYYDLPSGKKSETYLNVFTNEGRLIAYMEADEDRVPYLVIRDIFDESRYYQTVKRNFSFLTYSEMVPAGEFLDDHTLELTYYTEAEEEITEIIDLYHELG